MLKEFCAENCEHLKQAVKQDVQRVELCDNLAVGGTTPSYGVIQKAVNLGKHYDVDISTMIRPRGGDFNYSQDEKEIMKADIEQAKNLGTTGVVFGCLTSKGVIDKESMKELLKMCEGIEVTFHMAYDHIKQEKQLTEMDWLIEQGVTRILTHGGVDGSVLENKDWINGCIEHANAQIEILVGGGVTHKNVEELNQVLHTNQFHGTKIVSL